MNRPRTIWLGFALCLAVLLVATGWVSWTALRLNAAQTQMRQGEAIEEKVRLALWRMDSMLAPLIAQESARPYFTYNAFYPADRAYGKMFKPLDQGENLVSSPLLTQVCTNVLLHFQFSPEGRLTSPQLPEGAQRALAERQFTTAQHLGEATLRLRAFESLMRRVASAHSATGKGPPSNREILMASLPESNSQQLPLPETISQQPFPALQMNASAQIAQAQQAGRNQRELQNRSQSVQQALSYNNIAAVANTMPDSSSDVAQGALKAVWVDGALILARRVVAQRQEYVQGCWLDWPGLRRWLLDSVKDLCPAAELQISQSDPQGRILASLPVRLLPGPGVSDEDAERSPIGFILGLAWGCMILATLAVAVLLHGVLSLSERRAMFVSAVSHELRTPLTTFKMYSEMLAAGMVPEESARRHYLNTLCSEANRLGHLVENVLSYARLERGSARAQVENLTVGELLSRIQPRLEERASQVGLRICNQIDPAAREMMLRIDVTAVEQILFNLVDNACKYAVGRGAEEVLRLETPALHPGFVSICVRDHGPGLSDAAKRMLFQPFGKSAQDAAKDSPGVGLGLALCLRLSRSLGGDLRLAESNPLGTIFELRLPVKKS